MAVYVTDTHPLLWYTTGRHSQLPPRIVRIFDDAFREHASVVIPSAVLWEISLLVEHDKVRLREPFAEWAAALVARRGVDLSELGLDVIAEAHRLRFHGDPFDRAIVATARIMDLPLITKDQRIVESNLVEITW